MNDRERGTDSRGTHDRRTGNRGLPDAGAPSGRTPGRPDAGSDVVSSSVKLPEIGLLVYQVAKEGVGRYSPTIPEGKIMCEQPKRGLWQHTRLVGSVASLVGTVQSFAAQFKIMRLGILAHGGRGGTLEIGPDSINPGTFETFRGSISQLRSLLAPNADVFLLGCTAGASKGGSALLKEISRILPGRRIIGFNVINGLNPFGSAIGNEGGRPCTIPNIFCTNVQFDNVPFRWMNEATDSAPQAKIAKDGKIIRWPTFTDGQQIFPEHPPIDDSTLEKEAPLFGGPPSLRGPRGKKKKR